MNRSTSIALGLVMGLFSTAALSQAIGDPVAGQEKAQTCIACHGAKGAADNPAFPMLAGQHADYLLHTLRAYQSGDRVNAIMNGQAANLSEEDMRDLAAFYSQLEPALHTPDRSRR